MHRFLVGQEGFQGDQVRIRGADARQIRRVLRLRPGDSIEVLDGRGLSFLAVLEEVSQTEVRGRLIEMMGRGEESALIITLAQALPRWPKMDLIVKKATELGASQIIPLLAERTPSRGEAGGSKLSRWRRIAKESAEQCLRQTAPEIEPPQDLVTFLERGLPGVKIVFWEGETERRLRQALRADPSSAYTLLVGPEGGFSLQEVERARARGYISVSLGPRILRTESVALVALSVLQYELGDLG